MSTNNPDNAMNRLYRTRWFMPAFCLLVAALMFTAFAIGGDAASGAYSAAVLLFVGAVFYFGARRSETLAGLGGPYAALGAVGGLAYVLAVAFLRWRS
jgi:hypothetical protein